MNYIEENALKEKLNKVKDWQFKALNRELVDNSSIVARAKKSIMQFPVYTTKSLRADEAQIIAKMLEKVYSSFVQTVINQEQIVNYRDIDDMKFLTKFHTNIEERAMVFEFDGDYVSDDELSKIFDESVNNVLEAHNGVLIEFNELNERIDIMSNLSRMLCNDPLDGFDYLQENRGNKKVSTFKVTEPADVFARLMQVVTASNGKIKEADYMTNKLVDIDKLNNIMASNAGKDALKSLNLSSLKMNNDKSLTIKVAKEDANKDSGGNTKPSGPKLKSSKLPNFLNSGDVKKMNDMDPFLLQATFIIKNKGKENSEMTFIIGIKTVLHIVETSSLVDDIADIVGGQTMPLKRIRYKTGEIQLADYLFNIDAIKRGAIKRTNKNKRWVGTLNRLSDYGKLKGTIFTEPLKSITSLKSAVPIPNGSFLMSNLDAKALLDETGVDLMDIKIARSFAQNLFLITVIIVDSSDATLKMVYADSKDTKWEIHPLSSIANELSRRDNSNITKELGKLINK